MQTGELTEPTAAEKPPWYRDVRVLRILVQIVILIVVIGIAAFLLGNMISNMRRQGITFGFDYLTQPAEFTIPGSGLQRTDTRFEAILVGVGNTFRVAIAGILFATILGVLLGIARLSKNWLLSTGARLYVEFFRNIPLLVIIIFAYLVVFLNPNLFPPFDGARIFGPFIVYVRGIFLPWYEGRDTFFVWVMVMLVGAAAGYLVARWRNRVNERTGAAAYTLLWGIGTFLLFAIVGYFVLDRPVTITVPGFEGELVVGGIRVSPEYAALLVSLVLYTASHIAEITRASIQSVPKGQSEAATALGLTSSQRIRYVVLPQAFRVAIPPLANQYLNLTKNSSLAVAIAYYELTKVTSDIIGNGAPAPQSFLLLMVIYLVISLVIAGLTNIVNRRVALVER